MRRRRLLSFFSLPFDSASYFYRSAVFVFLATICFIGIIFHRDILYWFHTMFQPTSLDTVVLSESQSIDSCVSSCPFTRLLDGVCVQTADDVHEPVIAVMVENHIDARPLSGIADASVVYEAPVEGHITRFMALYPASQEVAKVGPVRSARPYYVSWAQEYGSSVYFHVGGSPDAISLLQTVSVIDMNEFYRGWYFWRSRDRYAPHNTYTSSVMWQKAVQDYASSFVTTTFSSWIFDFVDTCVSSSTVQGPMVDTISFRYGSASYAPFWKFSSSTNMYTRHESSRVVRDEDGHTIEVNTLIVQYVDASILDAEGRLDLDTQSGGKALLFMHGSVIEGLWKKNQETKRTEWVSLDGQTIALVPGNIWIAIATPFVDVRFE